MPALHRCRKQDDKSRRLKPTDPAAWARGNADSKKEDKDDPTFDPAFQPGKQGGVVMQKGDVCEDCGLVIG